MEGSKPEQRIAFPNGKTAGSFPRASLLLPLAYDANHSSDDTREKLKRSTIRVESTDYGAFECYIYASEIVQRTPSLK